MSVWVSITADALAICKAGFFIILLGTGEPILFYMTIPLKSRKINFSGEDELENGH